MAKLSPIFLNLMAVVPKLFSMGPFWEKDGSFQVALPAGSHPRHPLTLLDIAKLHLYQDPLFKKNHSLGTHLT